MHIILGCTRLAQIQRVNQLSIMAEAISMEDIKNAMSTQKIKPLNRTVIFPHRVGSILPSVVDDKLAEVCYTKQCCMNSERWECTLLPCMPRQTYHNQTLITCYSKLHVDLLSSFQIQGFRETHTLNMQSRGLQPLHPEF